MRRLSRIGSFMRVSRINCLRLFSFISVASQSGNLWRFEDGIGCALGNPAVETIEVLMSSGTDPLSEQRVKDCGRLCGASRFVWTCFLLRTMWLYSRKGVAAQVANSIKT